MATKEPLVEVHGEHEYELEPVHYKGKCVGLAPTKMIIGKSSDDALEWLTNEYGSEAIVGCFTRQLKQDVKNTVRAKYNKDKVTASAVIKACNSGQVSPEEYAEAWKQTQAGKYKDLTTAICTLYLGTGEDALKNADPSHKHWDCAR